MACGRPTQPASPPPRIAVLRCENLSGDTSIDWMGRGLSEILAAQLSAVRVSGTGRPAAAPGISAEREAALTSGAGRTVACEFSAEGGVLRVSAQVEDEGTLRIVERAQAQGPVNGIVSVAGALAAKLSQQARPSPTRSQEAIHAFAEGLERADPAAASEAYSRAVAADPNFGLAYLGWLSLEVARRDRAAAEHVLELAKARGDAIPAYDRARLALDAADLHGDTSARILALRALAKTGPPDAAVYRGLAEAALQGRRYRDAVNAYQQALTLAPDDPALLNAQGYAYAYLGDLHKALDVLRRYERLQPNQANPLDSQADVNFYSGHYAEAEKLYLAALAKDSAFLGGAGILKAAQARLMTGDIAGADTIFQRYTALLEQRHDPSMAYRKAQWKYLTGRRREAIAMLNAEPVQAAQAQAQMVLWELALGEKAAADRAARAMAAVHGAPPVLLAVAALLTQPQTGAAEWEARATKMFGQGLLRDQVSAYALLFGRRFGDALPLLRRVWEQTNPNNEEGQPVLLAWAMIESGKWDGITSLVGPTPIPQAAGPGPLMSLYFPRLFYLRARNFERLGKHDQALENYRLYLKLAGNEAEVWGEEQRAREALGR